MLHQDKLVLCSQAVKLSVTLSYLLLGQDSIMYVNTRIQASVNIVLLSPWPSNCSLYLTLNKVAKLFELYFSHLCNGVNYNTHYLRIKIKLLNSHKMFSLIFVHLWFCIIVAIVIYFRNLNWLYWAFLQKGSTFIQSLNNDSIQLEYYCQIFFGKLKSIWCLPLLSLDVTLCYFFVCVQIYFPFVYFFICILCRLRNCTVGDENLITLSEMSRGRMMSRQASLGREYMK